MENEGSPTKKALTNIDDTTMAPKTQRGNIFYIPSDILNICILPDHFFFARSSPYTHTSRYPSWNPMFLMQSSSLATPFFYYYGYLHISSELTVFVTVQRSLLYESSFTCLLSNNCARMQFYCID